MLAGGSICLWTFALLAGIDDLLLDFEREDSSESSGTWSCQIGLKSVVAECCNRRASDEWLSSMLIVPSKGMMRRNVFSWGDTGKDSKMRKE